MQMALFILRRIVHGIFILLGVSLITFFLINQSPGDYFSQMELDPQINREWLKQERERLKLGQPWPETYVAYVKGIVTAGDFGRSLEYKQPVFSVLGSRVMATLLLSFTSLVFAWTLSLPLGIIAAYRQYSWIDKGAATIAFVGLSLPNVFLALVALYFAATTELFPLGGLFDQAEWNDMNRWERFVDVAHHLVLPTIVLGTSAMAVLMRQMRGQMLDVLRSDYIRTARAKGLSERSVLFKHAVRNAVNPLITIFGYEISALLSGAVLVEQVMSYPGLGQMTLKALTSKDVYLVMASVLMAAALLIIGNLIADIMLAWSDPRIKLEDRASAG